MIPQEPYYDDSTDAETLLSIRKLCGHEVPNDVYLALWSNYVNTDEDNVWYIRDRNTENVRSVALRRYHNPADALTSQERDPTANWVVDRLIPPRMVRQMN